MTQGGPRDRTRPKVVVAGLGDTGLLTAIHLAKRADVVGISSKPGLVSGQELGVRLTRPSDWARDYWISFDRYRKLDGVRTVHGSILGADLDGRTVTVAGPDGGETTESYDALVIATGVTNGFWRKPELQSEAEVEGALTSAHDRLASSSTVVVLGGGAAAVSSALNVARTWPDKKVHLYFPGERALPQHHHRVWTTLAGRLDDLGVEVHPGHRAVIPDGFACDEITAGPVAWSTGQDPVDADAVLWTIGRVRPNTGWLPADVLDEHGFVAVDEHLRVTGRNDVFAIGDVAATDPLRNSARSRADGLLADNVIAALRGGALKTFQPAKRRWGSVVGVQPNGLEVFAPTGKGYRFPAWTINTVLQPWIVRRGIYGGVRKG
ncbi:NADH dehydrogenase FAD-containing subunit [Marmoricola sp. OAE513]|uniref:NAD(P)/FAD-dependent oxidoreductase n=1 Tax=Marmoricola sp. OAE513 TaxID=2817894 RepID=UPI001AEB4CEB